MGEKLKKYVLKRITYVCRNCGFEFEYMTDFTVPTPIKCKKCKKEFSLC